MNLKNMLQQPTFSGYTVLLTASVACSIGFLIGEDKGKRTTYGEIGSVIHGETQRLDELDTLLGDYSAGIKVGDVFMPDFDSLYNDGRLGQVVRHGPATDPHVTLQAKVISSSERYLPEINNCTLDEAEQFIGEQRRINGARRSTLEHIAAYQK